MEGNRDHAGGRISAVLILLVILFAVFLALWAMAPPKIIPVSSPPGEFSAERAFGLLKEIAAKPHALGMPAHDEVRDTLLRMWRGLGFEPAVQKGLFFDAKRHYAARIENILVRLPGTHPVPGGALMLATHYDSVESAPGAADAGSGVVTLLETARALKAGLRPARDIIFLATDAEEDGMLGASVFQAEHPWAKDVGLVMNFEARGTNGPSLMFQTSSGNQALISALAAVPHPRAYSMGGRAYRSMPNNGDLSVWLAAGIQGMNFAFIGRPYDYHTAGDNLARLDLRSLQHHGSSALALARRFADGGVPARSRGDAVHFSLFGDVFIFYSRLTAFSLVGIIAVLLVFSGVLGLRRGILRLSGILRGLLFMIASLALSGGLGFGFLTLVQAAHGAWLPPAPFRTSAAYLSAAAVLAAAATIFLHGLFRARKSRFGLAFGAAILWLVLAAAVTLFALDVSYVTMGPALALAFGILVWAGFGKRDGEDAAPPFWSSALAAIGIVLIAVPLVFLLFQAMFLSPLIAAILAALVSLMIAAMTPAIEIARRGLGRGLPVIFISLFLVLTGVSAISVRYTAEIPRAVNLQYIQDFDSSRAYWVTPTKPPSAWLEKVAGGEFRLGHPQPEYVLRSAAYSFREAPLSSMVPPEVRVIEDVSLSVAGASVSSASSRVLKLRIVSPRGGRRIVLAVKAEKMESAEIEGRPVELIPQNVSGFAFSILNPGPQGFEVRLKTAAAAVQLTVRESNPGFPDLPGFSPPPPPLGIRPNQVEVLLHKTFVFPPPAK